MVSTRWTIEQWVELFNAGDAEGISALYAEGAVNHQIALDPVTGRAAIEQFHRDTFAGGPLTCSPINLVVDGDAAGSFPCVTDRSCTSGATGTARSSR